MNRPSLKHILYVEDDRDLRLLGNIALGQIGGFSPKVCASGREALEAVAAGYVPDLILLDVMMPGMDGPATLAALRQLAPTAGTPTIFITAKRQESEVAYYKSLGAMSVLAKPFDPTQLAQQLHRLWEEDHG